MTNNNDLFLFHMIKYKYHINYVINNVILNYYDIIHNNYDFENWDDYENYNEYQNFYIPKQFTKNDINFLLSLNANDILEPNFYSNLKKTNTHMYLFVSNLFMEYRRYLIRNIGYTFLSETNLYELAEFMKNYKTLEINAGLGFYSSLLQLLGCNIIITDINDKLSPYTNIEELTSIEAIQKYPDVDILLTIWPDYINLSAYHALKLFKGKFVIYIGESKYGCTATLEFFNELQKSYTKIKSIDKPIVYHDLKDTQIIIYRNNEYL